MKKILFIILIITSSCDNEPVGETFVNAEDLINVNSELYQSLKFIAEDEPTDVAACLDFIYSFSIIVYDPNLEIIDFSVINSDQELIHFLISVEEGNSISLSYPITSILANGEAFIINNNDELQTNLKNCLEEETINYCNNIIEDCIWNITPIDGGNNDFEGSYFNVSSIGNAWLHHNDEVFLGTWISLYIEDELHLNINLNDENNVGESFNFDWKVTIPDPEHMNLINDEGALFNLEKECFPICKQIVFEECEIELDSGIANFNLGSYIECFLPFTIIEDSSEYSFTFHETIDDALSGENSLDSQNYLNTENPQEIFVRMIENETEGILPILSIFLAAVICE
jgi:hypothetical protein